MGFVRQFFGDQDSEGMSLIQLAALAEAINARRL
jgi:hypothetical protein